VKGFHVDKTKNYWCGHWGKRKTRF